MRKLTDRESEYLESGEEPVEFITTGLMPCRELYVHYLDETTIVDTDIGDSWAYDEILEPEEVLQKYLDSESLNSLFEEDFDEQDRRAYQEEKLSRKRPSEY